MSVTVSGIVMDFPGVRALDQVSADFRFDEVHGLIGENGAGKSTLMSILAGTQAPSAGTITIDGNQTALRSARDAMARGIALVSQEGSLVPALTAAENVLLGVEPRSGSFIHRSELNRQAARILETWFPGVEIDMTVPVDRLDMADRKVVEIVRALRGDVRLLILDEPTATLQSREKRTLWTIIRSLPAKGVGVVLISHFLSEVKELCDRITVLRDGQYVGTFAAGAVTEADLVEHMLKRGGSTAAELRLDSKHIDKTRPPVLAVKDWTIGGVHVADFSICHGEVVGLIGLTGAGHFGFARSLYAGVGVTSGTLSLDGEPVAARGPRAMQRLGVGFIPDHRMENALMAEGTITENLSIVHPQAGSVGGFIRPARERREALSVMESLNVRATGPGQTVKTLSGGNKQKVSLGKWLYGAEGRYRLMIFIEPTEGVDVGAKQEIYGHIKRLAEQGVAVIVASSDLLEMEQITHRVVPFVAGRPMDDLHVGAYSEARFIAAMAGEPA